MADTLTLDIEKTFASGARIAAALDVTLEAGSMLVLFGLSGAGKTTIVRSLAGLERPERGVIRFGDETWFDSRAARCVGPQQRKTGCVFQPLALFPHLMVRDNVGYGLAALPERERAARVDEMIGLVGLRDLERRYPRELSGGQAQRVALARALAPGPRLLLLDEPFAALDVPTRGRLRREFRAVIARAGISAVIVTHDRTEAIAIGDQIAIVEDGRVRQTGPVQEVFRRPANADVARTLGVESVLPAIVEGADGGLLRLRAGGVLLRAVETDPQPPGAEVFACIRAEDVSLETTSPSTSVRNHVPGRVVAIEPEGPVERITLDCGFPLVAVITRQAREDLSLQVGLAILAAIKATSVHVVPRS